MIDRNEQTLLWELREGLPLCEDPYGAVAHRLGIKREELILRIRSLLDRGVIRRFGARINQRNLGIRMNAMVAWKVPGERIEEVGRAMAAHPEVTHCYERAIVPSRWEYTLYTVVHAYDQESISRYIQELSLITGVEEHIVLFSTAEFKKIPAGRVAEVAGV